MDHLDQEMRLDKPKYGHVCSLTSHNNCCPNQGIELIYEHAGRLKENGPNGPFILCVLKRFTKKVMSGICKSFPETNYNRLKKWTIWTKRCCLINPSKDMCDLLHPTTTAAQIRALN